MFLVFEHVQYQLELARPRPDFVDLKPVLKAKVSDHNTERATFTDDGSETQPILESLRETYCEQLLYSEYE